MASASGESSSAGPEEQGGDRWSLIPEEEWTVYRGVLEEARARGLPFALGGGMAFSHYAKRWRYTKDVDIYIEPRHREAAIEVITHRGFEDYYARAPYDRNWIYRGWRDGLIVDIIWSLANYRAPVEPFWLERAMPISIRGTPVKMLAVEELFFAKLYVVQRERCDWPDLLSILYQESGSMDWDHLLEVVGEDVMLVGGLLNLFRWLCPVEAASIPSWVWSRAGLLEPGASMSAGAADPVDPPDPGAGLEHPADCTAPVHARQVALLDSRDWFGPEKR
jgi:hypothetical protein